MIQDVRYIDQYMNNREGKESLDIIQNMETLKHNLPLTTPTPAESQEQARIMTEVNTYIQEMATRYILGVENLSSYDNFINTLKRMRLERAVEIQQAAYTRFMAR
jgi:putative aldouronate transport system substrate-binding protein